MYKMLDIELKERLIKEAIVYNLLYEEIYWTIYHLDIEEIWVYGI